MLSIFLSIISNRQLTLTTNQIRMLLKILICLTIVESSNPLFKNYMKKLKDKASGIYKSRYGKDKTWHFLGHDQSEYPGNNAKYIEMNKNKWNEYYTCLKRQNENLGKYLSVSPEAIVGFEGNNIKLSCKLCISPQESEKTDSIEWDWAPQDGKHFEPIEFSEHIYVSPEDKTLHLYNLQFENTGQYVCKLGESLTAPYFLTVANVTDEDMIEVHPPEAPLGPYPKDPEDIENYNLFLDTDWTDWSVCSVCGKIGRRHKVGYCSIYSKEYQEKNLSPLTNNTMLEDKFGIAEKGETKNNVAPIELELFNIFKYGIPCNSHMLPASIKELAQVKNRKNELMVGYCKIKCPKSEVFEVKDKEGRILEKANNSAGIYSLLQSLPPLEPTIERLLLYRVKGKTITLTCPGNLNSDAPIQWQIGNKNLIPELISKESGGRIFISITDRVHIKNAKVADSNIYSCWQQNEMAGTIRLIVEKKFEMNFNHHIMLLGIVIILSVFLYVFLKAFAGRKYARIK